MAVRIALRFLVMVVCIVSAPAFAVKPSDVGKIPHLDSRGREGFREFLAAAKHRAFVVAPGGAWAWKGDAASADVAVEEAIQECQQGTEQPCVPYIVDDKVIFDVGRWATLWGPYPSRAEAAKAHIGKERGDLFFDLAINSPTGKPMKISDLRGRVVMLHFWGTWCPPCRREMPELQKLQQALGATSGVQLVLLQMREDSATARRWAQQQSLMLPLYDSGVKDMGSDKLTLANGKTIPDRRMAVAFPTTYVLDKHGIVVFSHVGPVEGWLQYLPFLRDVAARSRR